MANISITFKNIQKTSKYVPTRTKRDTNHFVDF